ncbi:MAG: hypothetical protein J6U04_03865 [Salinivirgaceae bacterium]|nr:hypothetical protein [Salinivirgaceae bacterium]
MNRRLLLFALLGTLQMGHVSAQTGLSTSDATEYNRNSLTIMMVEGGKYGTELKEAISHIVVPEKFDDNMLDQRLLLPSDNSDNLRQQLEIMRAANRILAKWFSRSDDGKFNMSVIHERGLYNATDADVVAASASKRGLSKLQDAGEKLISHSYVMVMAFGKIKTMDEIYDEQDAARRKAAKASGKEFVPVSRTKNGYKGEVAGFLFRLSDVPQAMDNFYSNMWIFDDDSPATIAAKRQMFDTTTFKMSFVTSVVSNCEATQSNLGTQMTKAQLFDVLMNNSVRGLVYGFENKVDEWKVRTALYSTFPLRAKIGTKENLAVEDRYFVYEFRMNKNNEVYADRRGVVRAKKVVNNSHVAEGSGSDDLKNTTSKFYQIAGHKLEPGMFLEQSNDMGLGVTVGGAAGSLGGAYISIEGLAGQYLGITQLKVFLGGHIGFNSYELDYSSDNTSVLFYGGELGISKGYFIMRNVSVSGQAGMALEWGDILDSKVKEKYYNDCLVQGLFGFVGAQLAVNIKYNAQIVGGLNYYAEIGNATLTKDTESDESKDLGVGYSKVFDGRAGANINVGLRIQF